MIEYFEVSECESGHRLSSPLSIIKSSIIKRQEVLGDWVAYESEGYLDGVEALVLSIKISVPSISPFGILKNEKIAVCCSNHERPLLKACALRKNFPDLPHLILTPKDQPRELCLFDVQFMDHMYNKTFMDFVGRIKKWLDRAAVGELHLGEQPMEPLIMSSIGDFVLDGETYEKIINGESLFELFPKYFLEPDEFTHRYYIEVGSKRRSDKKSKNPFAVLCLKSEPSNDQCISNRPDNYLDLYELLQKKLSIDLDRELYHFIQRCYKTRDVGKAYLDKYLILVICIPRLNSKGEISIPEIVVFHINKKLVAIGLSVGCLRQQAKKKEYIYILQDDFDRKEGKLQKIKVFPFQTIKPFTKQLAANMAGISENMTNNSISVIGQGALGSQLVLNLARQGYSDWRLIDGDILLPHNFARHGVSAVYKGSNKAVALKNEIDHILDKPNVKAYPTKFVGLNDKSVGKIFSTDIILDCSASYNVLLDLAYRKVPNSRTLGAYCCGEGYTSILICEDSERKIRLDDIDLQLKVKGLENPLIQNTYRVRENNQLIYSTSCNNTTSVVAQDLLAIHSGILSREVKKAIQNSNAHVFVNLIQKDGFGVQVEGFIPSRVIIQDSEGWQFRISLDALDEMNRFRNEKLPNETGGVLIGWINSFKKIIYVGKVLPAPADSIERPYYFQRGKERLYELVQQLDKMSNGDLYYVGEWHSHPPQSSVTQSPSDKQCMKKISEFMLEDGLPGVLLIIGDSNNIGYYVNYGW